MTDEDPGWRGFGMGFAAGTVVMFVVIMSLLFAIGPTDVACAVCP